MKSQPRPDDDDTAINAIKLNKRNTNLTYLYTYNIRTSIQHITL